MTENNNDKQALMQQSIVQMHAILESLKAELQAVNERADKLNRLNILLRQALEERKPITFQIEDYEHFGVFGIILDPQHIGKFMSADIDWRTKTIIIRISEHAENDHDVKIPPDREKTWILPVDSETAILPAP